MNMIEKVEKALDPLDVWDEYLRRNLAIAAVEAMREPTGVMCDAFNDAFPTAEGETLLRDVAPVVFNAMIDAALANKGPSPEGDENA